MSSNPFKDFTFHIGEAGPSGDITGSATLTDHETRITTLEGNTPPTVIDDLTDVDTTTSAPSSGDLLEFDGTNWVPVTPSAITVTTGLSFIIYEGGDPLTTGVKGDVVIPFAGTITSWRLLADVSGSITVNVWKDTYANHPPTSGDAVFNPDITSDIKNFANITQAVSAGDILRVNVASASTITRCTLVLTIDREVGP